MLTMNNYVDDLLAGKVQEYSSGKIYSDKFEIIIGKEHIEIPKSKYFMEKYKEKMVAFFNKMLEEQSINYLKTDTFGEFGSKLMLYLGINVRELKVEGIKYLEESDTVVTVLNNGDYDDTRYLEEDNKENGLDLSRLFYMQEFINKPETYGRYSEFRESRGKKIYCPVKLKELIEVNLIIELENEVKKFNLLSKYTDMEQKLLLKKGSVIKSMKIEYKEQEVELEYIETNSQFNRCFGKLKGDRGYTDIAFNKALLLWDYTKKLEKPETKTYDDVKKINDVVYSLDYMGASKEIQEELLRKHGII